ncbi:MAG: PAS domain S-box protein, partial [Rudaea sp.]
MTRTTFAFFYVAVLISAWVGGFGPAALATALGLVNILYFVIPPVGTFVLPPDEAPNLATFAVVSLVIGLFAAARERAAAAAHADREQLQVTLTSIGDGVIVTDSEGKIDFLNPVAQALTGWSQEEAEGQALAAVFKIVNEEQGISVDDPVAKVLRSGKTVGLGNHTVLIARDGSRLPIDDSAAPIRSKAGKITGVVLVFRDIRERRAAEKALQESEERFRALIENSSDAIATLDPDGTVRYASASNAQVLGYAPEEMIGKNALDLMESSDREGMVRVFETVAASPGSAETGHFRFRRKDGAFRWLEGTARNLIQVPSVGGVVLNYRDITERTEAAQALRESRDELAVILRGITEGITVQDPSGRLVYANDAGARLMGYATGEELIATPTDNVLARFEMRDESGQMITPDHLPGRVALAGRTAPPLLTRFRERATGIERWAQVEAATVLDSEGRVRFVINIFRDMTERKEYEQRLALQHSVSRLLSDASSLDEAAPHLLLAIGETLAWDAAAFWDLDRDAGKLRNVANWHSSQLRLAEFEGLAERTLLAEGVGLPGRAWQSHSGMWVEDFAASRYLRAVEAEQAGLQTAYALPVMLGSEVLGVIELFSRTHRPEEPELVTLLGTVAAQVGQFAQRQRAQEAVRDSEERMRTIADTASDGIITIDSESRILFVNQAVGQIFGYTSEELQDKSLTMLMPREQRELHFASLKRYIHTGQRRRDWARIEMTGRRKDGSNVPLEISLGEFVKNGKHFFTGVVRDVTAGHEAEEQMRFQAGILQNVRDAIVVSDLQGQVLYWNVGATQVYGYSAEEMEGQALSLLYPEIDEEKLLDGLHRLLAGGDDQGEWKGRRKEGRDVWVSIKTTVLRNKSGRATGFIQVSQDITERHQTGLALATSEERFRSLSANSPIGIFLADIEGRITYTNPAFSQMLAITAGEQLAGEESWMALVHPDDKHRVM